MTYPEFKNLKELNDSKNPFCKLYELEDGERFYIEPVFYTQLKGFEERHDKESYQKIIDRMLEVVKKNKRVVFVGNFEYPQTDVDGYIFLEITDITNPLQIFVEDKSRGSDYGD